MPQNKQNSEVVAKKRCCRNNTLFGHYFTILFILYHSALLQYLNLVSTSLFCLFCGIQHYYNIFFWPLLHYFVYSVQFNITTTPFLASPSLFCSIHHNYNTFIWSLLHYFVYSVAFNITTTSFLGHYFTILFILRHSTLLQHLFLATTSLKLRPKKGIGVMLNGTE
jgi:hypothetical protein